MTYIYIFNNASRAAVYGIGTYVRQLTDGMLAVPDTKVSLVEIYADTKEFAVTDDERGLRHLLIPPLRSGVENEDYCRTVFYFLARSIEAGDSDKLVFQFNYFQHYSLALLLKSWRPDCRIVLTVHYLGWCFELKGNVRRMKEITAEDYEPTDDAERKVLSSIHSEKVFMHLADVVIVLSRRTKEILTEDYKVSESKLSLVYNGTDDKAFERKKAKKRNVLFVGRLDEIKGLKYLIDAFLQIAPPHPDTNLVIAGDGDFHPYLHQSRKLSSRVAFMGKMSSEEVDELYQSAYIGVMPSMHEQCSYTAIEMMRHGIPVVGTDSTGLSEMLDMTPDLRVCIDEEIFNEEDFVAQMASRMDLLLTDADAHKRASRAVRKMYEERYTQESMTNGMRDSILASLAGGKETVSHDFLQHIDIRMMQLINQRPDIDTEFFGMSGIGVYLWHRLQEMKGKATDNLQFVTLQEYLIYYIDWLYDASRIESLPQEIIPTLEDMLKCGFYKTVVRSILLSLDTNTDRANTVDSNIIIINALRICSCKV